MIGHDTLIEFLKFLGAAATAFGVVGGALITYYLKGKATIDAKRLEREEKLEEQKAAAAKEREEAVNTHVTLLKDSVIGLSAEVKAAREIQAKQDVHIANLDKTVTELRNTVGALSNRIREFLGSQVDSNEKRTLVRTVKKGT